MSSFLSKLVLGTASWGNPYGLLNEVSLQQSDVAEILSTSSVLGIRGLDTASAYGNSERLIGSSGKTRLPVYTKPQSEGLTPESLRSRVKNSLHNLGVEFLEGLTLHSPTPLLSNTKKFEIAIAELVSEGLIRSWGVSVYEPSEALVVANIPTLNYIQAPASVFDQRFLDPRLLCTLEGFGVGIQLRSIFLQGLLLDEAARLPKSLAALGPKLEDFGLFCKGIGSSREEVAVAFVAASAPSADLVIGVNSIDHLKSLVALNLPAMESIRELSNFKGITRELTDPRRW